MLEVWRAKDRGAWTDVAFDIVKEILIKRLGELPVQDDLAPSDENENEETVIDELGLEAWEVHLLEAEIQPEYYDTK